MKTPRFGAIHFLLGALLGVALTFTVVRYRENKHLVNTRYGSWTKLNLVLDLLEKNYVDTLPGEKITQAGITSVLAALDPHSTYLPPVELTASEEQLSGKFEGIGLQFNVPADTAIVLEVIAGGPSEKAGILTGDRIIKVDDKVIAGVKCPQDSMVAKMRGPSGTKVTITVKRGTNLIPFEITRGKIPVHSLDAAFMLRDSIGYMRLSKFSRTTFQECRDAALSLEKKGMAHLIFDLRANSGGYLDQALLLTNDYLEAGDTIVYLEGLHRARQVYTADGRGLLKDMDITVLISENSASASEIFAGAIQDNDRGRIVGRRSYGKGLVQEPFFFSDNSGIRLTVARYYTPSGRCIQKPYSGSSQEAYDYDIYNRYMDGEVFSRDSVRLDSSDVHYTKKLHRRVYGGGGIMPDEFVPVDTTRTTAFYRSCNAKATAMRFASVFFDSHRGRILSIDSFEEMDRFLSGEDIASAFRRYALKTDGIGCTDAQWAQTEGYLLPEIHALIARYSPLGENAFYRYWLPVDTTLTTALDLI